MDGGTIGLIGIAVLLFSAAGSGASGICHVSDWVCGNLASQWF